MPEADEDDPEEGVFSSVVQILADDLTFGDRSRNQGCFEETTTACTGCTR